MSDYYRAQRTRNLFHTQATEPFRLSRSKIDLFINCQRCFYLDRKLGISQPPSFPFNLNSAVDKLLKKEFDIHRAAGNPHPLMKAYGVDAIPYKSEYIDVWRDALRGGISYLHKKTNFLITGGIDDVWVNPFEELIIVDYKATAKEEEVTIDAQWQISYKRQMEIYQWLFRKNGFTVSPTGYFVYCNGNTDKKAFDGRLEFDIKLIPYTGDDSWIEQIIEDAYACLKGDILPQEGVDCDFCKYRRATRELENA